DERDPAPARRQPRTADPRRQPAAHFDRRHDRVRAVQSRPRPRSNGPEVSVTAARRLPRLLLVTGMSGAGKSTVLDALEDMGWDTRSRRTALRRMESPASGSLPAR